MTNSKAFVAGATGFTGRAVVEVLVGRGVETIAHVRPDSPQLEQWRERFSALGARVDTTPWSEEAMIGTLKSLSPYAVFALLGTTRARARSEGRSASSAYEAVDYGMSALLLSAAEECAEPPRFVYLSSIGAESGKGAYLSARKKVEDRLAKSEVPWTIARPSIITGARDEPRRAERAAGVIADGCLAALGVMGAHNLRRRYRSTSNQELAERLVELAFDPAAARGVFEGASLDPVADAPRTPDSKADCS